MSTKNNKESPNISKMWGGRFSGGPNKIMEQINSSIDFDKRLCAEDISASKAHVVMLGDQGIIPTKDVQKILSGLDTIHKEIDDGKFPFKRDLEDIHLNVEDRLSELIGDVAGSLHTARSRNDQVAVDFKLWVRGSIDVLDNSVKALQATLIDIAACHVSSAMPGFTHLQVGQPITLGHHLLAYVEMLGRDRGRLIDCRKRLNENPLGSVALAGTSFPIDRCRTSALLGFDRPTANSVDSVSDRDFALEYLSLASILSVHLSRLAEDYVLWCSSQFEYAKVSDAFSTGSSIMPQKRNPDAAELVRGKTGRVVGALFGLLTVMKGLPMTYVKDMQEDKESLFDVHDTLTLSLAAMTGMLKETIFNQERMAMDAKQGFSTATDLADWLVRVLNIPFRKAHRITGEIVKLAEKNNVELSELPLSQLKSIEAGINENIFEVLSLENSLNSRTSFGGTAPKNVAAAIKEARKRFLD